MPEYTQIIVGPSTRERWIECQNDTSPAEEIPGSALMRVTGVTSTGIIKVAKPNTNDQDCVVNGPIPIPAQTDAVPTYGICTRDFPAWALYDAADGTPAVTEVWGAMAGEWKLRNARMGFTIHGGAQGGRVQVVQTLAATGGTGTITVRRSDGSQTVLNVSILEVYVDDFTVTSPSPGIALLTPIGYTGTRLICDAAGAGGAGGYLPYVIARGLIKTVDGRTLG